MNQILYPVESRCIDELERFLRGFDFVSNGFSKWEQQARKGNTQGYICDHQIVYIATGTLRFSIQGQEHVCKPGSLILFEPFVVYTTEPVVSEEPLECYSIHFDIHPEHRQKEFVRRLLGRESNIFPPGELPQIASLFRNLFESRRKQALGVVLQTDLELRLAFLYMMRARWPKDAPAAISGRPESAREMEVVQSSIQYIQKNISRPLRLGEICEQLNISTNYLYKCFMEVLQVAPSRYILQYKIRISVDLMTTAGCSMEEIAERLGFSSPYHFSTTFKRVMGCSPRHYLKTISKGSV